MFNSSFIELDKSALAHNLDFVRSRLNAKCTLSFVVKGNAYGHGIDEIVPMAEDLGVSHFSVYSADEAVSVFEVAKNKPTIMVMGFLGGESVEWVVEKEIEFFVFELERLHDAIDAAKKVGKKARIHLELETGMNRTGLEVSQLPAVVRIVEEHKDHLELIGCCTHFAGAESISNYVRIKLQKRAFKKYLKYLRQMGLEFKQIHTSCSAAAIRYPDMHFDMVRIGIMNYGYWPSPETFIEFATQNKMQGQDPLKRVISWKSEVMALQQVEKGSFIGYGTSYLAHEDTTIAIVPVGYGYGFARNLSNTGRVLIGGMRAGVVGTVNMNSIAVNITNLEGVNIGDEVILIGGTGENQISVSSFSQFSEQLNYELLTRLPQKIPRIIK